jgi:hypothetical protein
MLIDSSNPLFLVGHALGFQSAGFQVICEFSFIDRPGVVKKSDFLAVFYNCRWAFGEATTYFFYIFKLWPGPIEYAIGHSIFSKMPCKNGHFGY